MIIKVTAAAVIEVYGRFPSVYNRKGDDCRIQSIWSQVTMNICGFTQLMTIEILVTDLLSLTNFRLISSPPSP